MLKLNQDKTELIVFASKHHANEFSGNTIVFDESVVTNVNCVKNLGVHFDTSLNMDKQSQFRKLVFIIFEISGESENLSLTMLAKLW